MKEDIQNIFEYFFLLFTGKSINKITCIQTHFLDYIVLSELHHESVANLIYFTLVQKLMHSCGINDFNLKDYFEPNFEKNITVLSALINFAKFRGEIIHYIQSLDKYLNEISVKSTDIIIFSNLIKKKISKILKISHNRKLDILFFKIYYKAVKLKKFFVTIEINEYVKNIKQRRYRIKEKIKYILRSNIYFKIKKCYKFKRQSFTDKLIEENSSKIFHITFIKSILKIFILKNVQLKSIFFFNTIGKKNKILMRKIFSMKKKNMTNTHLFAIRFGKENKKIEKISSLNAVYGFFFLTGVDLFFNTVLSDLVTRLYKEKMRRFLDVMEIKKRRVYMKIKTYKIYYKKPIKIIKIQ
jgi:hypothetical protein